MSAKIRYILKMKRHHGRCFIKKFASEIMALRKIEKGKIEKGKIEEGKIEEGKIERER